jgi:hypothetical protein
MDLEDVAAVALELGEAERECDRRERAWFDATQAAYTAHGSPPHDDRESPEVGGVCGPLAASNRDDPCWRKTSHGEYGEPVRLPEDDWCEACQAVATRRRDRTVARRKRGSLRAKLKRVTSTAQNFRTLDLAHALRFVCAAAQFVTARARVKLARKARAELRRAAYDKHREFDRQIDQVLGTKVADGTTICDQTRDPSNCCEACFAYFQSIERFAMENRGAQTAVRKLERVVTTGPAPAADKVKQ